MQSTLATLLPKLRIAIDEQLGTDVDSDFVTPWDAELKQALYYASLQLSKELPDDYLLPSSKTNSDYTSDISLHVENSDGTGFIVLPTDYLRLVRFKLRSWSRPCCEVTDASSELGRMQGNRWTRGTPQKPVCMHGVSGDGLRTLEYFTAGRYPLDVTTDGFDHYVDYLTYVSKPTLGESTLSSALTDECEPLVIYRAAGIVMDGKQNAALADRFYALSRQLSNKQ